MNCLYLTPVQRRQPYYVKFLEEGMGNLNFLHLTELHEKLFKQPFNEAHNATADVEATTRCFLELLRNGHYTQEELQVDSSYFVDFTTHNPQEFFLL